MKLTNSLIGKRVLVTFWDHCLTNLEEPSLIECVVCGEVMSLTNKQVVLRFWEAIGNPSDDEFLVLSSPSIISVTELFTRGGASKRKR